jgi:hypothetical protein
LLKKVSIIPFPARSGYPRDINPRFAESLGKKGKPREKKKSQYKELSHTYILAFYDGEFQ